MVLHVKRSVCLLIGEIRDVNIYMVVVHNNSGCTVDVGHAIPAIDVGISLDQWLLLFDIRWGPCIQRLFQLPVQHLDKAVCITVRVDAATLTFTPTQRHQVELAVARVDQVTRVPIIAQQPHNIASAGTNLDLENPRPLPFISPVTLISI